MSAHGAARREIGINAITIVLDRGNVIEAMEQRAGVQNCNDAVTGVGTASLHDFAFACGCAPISFHPEFQPDTGLRAGAVSDESLLTGKLHHHFAAAGTGEKRSDDFEIQRFNAGTKTTTDER